MGTSTTPATKVNFVNIPQELKNNASFCVWRYEKRNGRLEVRSLITLSTAPEGSVSIALDGKPLVCEAGPTPKTLCAWLPLVGYQMMGSSYFQSSGQPLKATILELTRQILFLIPLYLLFPPLAMSWFGVSGLTGVLLCVPISDALAFITTTYFVIMEVIRLRKLRDGAAQQPAL